MKNLKDIRKLIEKKKKECRYIWLEIKKVELLLNDMERKRK